MANPRIDRLAPLLVCPQCRATIDVPASGSFRCGQCNSAGRRTGSQIVFGELRREGNAGDALLSRKEAVKRRFPRLYPRLIEWFSPVHSPRLAVEFLRQVLTGDELVLDLGSGTLRHHPKVINVDLAPEGDVDLVCGVERLPFADGSVDAVMSLALLEHVAQPAAVVAEMHRVLRPGGRVYCYVPFMQGIHASPDDYQRYTPHGLEVLFAAFAGRRVSVAAGPASGFAWMLQEWTAMLLSFGSKRLYWAVYALMTAIVAPLKQLDRMLARHPFAANIASAFVIEARKDD